MVMSMQKFACFSTPQKNTSVSTNYIRIPARAHKSKISYLPLHSHEWSGKSSLLQLARRHNTYSPNITFFKNSSITCQYIDLSYYDSFSVKDQRTPDHITEVFNFSRNLLSCYEVGQIVGRGSFGSVRVAKVKASGKLCAIKSLPKLPPKASRLPDGEASLSAYLSKLDGEVDTLSRMKGVPQAVDFHGGFEDNTQVHIVMELCRGGSLQQRLNTEGAMSERETACVMYTTLQLLESCHNNGVVYRDIKPENFMYLNPRGDALLKQSFLEQNQVKVVDFGQSIHLDSACEMIDRRSGTPVYMAPEVIKQCYGAKADVWCAGMMMYQLLSNRLPFWTDIRNHSLKQVWTDILQSEINFAGDPWSSVSNESKDLIRVLLTKNPQKRPSAGQLLEHDWFQEQLGDDLSVLKHSHTEKIRNVAPLKPLQTNPHKNPSASETEPQVVYA
mmetsp:Transcript_8117/g.10965  ORF Transcript_8117/g.10965 Transcript_8117/m.10965 type:complete len:444 (-) Transcript_8117:287-1618(-)